MATARVKRSPHRSCDAPISAPAARIRSTVVPSGATTSSISLARERLVENEGLMLARWRP